MIFCLLAGLGQDDKMRSKLTKDGVFALSQYENQKSVWIEHTNTHAELCLTLEDIHEILKFMIEK